MSAPVLSVEGLSKSYKLGSIGRHTLVDEFQHLYCKLRGKDPKHVLGKVDAVSLPKQSNKEFWALKDVSFELHAGEVLGVIGGNGAGKSTLLKILSRVTEPTSGQAIIRGRVGSLLEVGTGFHPELTGRENVYMNGTILGMKKREVAVKFDEIVAFSGIEKFIDTPVKRYSSGMYVRLAFAVAAHLEPEILIVDEVLAVGDADFQKKCLGKMGEVAKGGRTVLFVSHNMNAVQNLCKRSIWLKSGRKYAEGPSQEIIPKYLFDQTNEGRIEDLKSRKDRIGTGRAKFVEFFVTDLAGNPQTVLQAGRDYNFNMISESPQHIEKVIGSIAMTNQRNEMAWLVRSNFSHTPISINSSRTCISCRIEDFNLAEGLYNLTLFLSYGEEEILDCVSNATSITVAGGDYFGTGEGGLPNLCSVLTRSKWEYSPCK